MCQHCDNMTPEQRVHAMTHGLSKARKHFLFMWKVFTVVGLILAPIDWLHVAVGLRRKHAGLKGNSLRTWSIDWYVAQCLAAYRDGVRRTLVAREWPARFVEHVTAPPK